MQLHLENPRSNLTGCTKPYIYQTQMVHVCLLQPQQNPLVWNSSIMKQIISHLTAGVVRWVAEFLHCMPQLVFCPAWSATETSSSQNVRLSCPHIVCTASPWHKEQDSGKEKEEKKQQKRPKRWENNRLYCSPAVLVSLPVTLPFFLVLPVIWQDGICIGFFWSPAICLQEAEEICSTDNVEQLRKEDTVLQQTFFF